MKFYSLLFLTLLFGTTCSYGQNDFGVWSSLGINAKVSKSIDIGLEGQARFDRNVSRMKEVFISPSIKWDVIDNLRLGADYRLSNVPYNSKSTNRVYTHRYTVEAIFRNILDLIVEKPRLGLSMRIRGTAEFESQKRNQNYLRLKLKADYNLPGTKLKPFVAAEMFYHFNDQLTYTFTEVSSTHSINKLRFKAGVSHPIMKNSTIKIFGQYQREILNQENNLVIGAGFMHDIEFGKN